MMIPDISIHCHYFFNEGDDEKLLSVNEAALALGNLASLGLSSLYSVNSLFPLNPFSAAYLAVNIAKQFFVSNIPEAGSHPLLKIATSPWMLCAAYVIRGMTQNRWLEVGVAGASGLTLALHTWKKKDAYLDALSENPLQLILASTILAINSGAEVLAAASALTASILNFQGFMLFSRPRIENWAQKEVSVKLRKISDKSLSLKDDVADCHSGESSFKRTSLQDLAQLETENLKPWEKDVRLDLAWGSFGGGWFQGGDCTRNIGRIFWEKNQPNHLMYQWLFLTDEEYLGVEKCCEKQELRRQEWEQSKAEDYNIGMIRHKFHARIEAANLPDSDLFERWRQTQLELRAPLILSDAEFQALSQGEMVYEPFKISESVDQQLNIYADRMFEWWCEVYSSWQDMRKNLNSMPLERRKEFEKYRIEGVSLQDLRNEDHKYLTSDNKVITRFEDVRRQTIEDARLPEGMLESLYKKEHAAWLNFRKEVEAGKSPLEVQEFEKSLKKDFYRSCYHKDCWEENLTNWRFDVENKHLSKEERVKKKLAIRLEEYKKQQGIP